jgi:hypothetical protein
MVLTKLQMIKIQSDAKSAPPRKEKSHLDCGEGAGLRVRGHGSHVGEHVRGGRPGHVPAG